MKDFGLLPSGSSEPAKEFISKPLLRWPHTSTANTPVSRNSRKSSVTSTVNVWVNVTAGMCVWRMYV